MLIGALVLTVVVAYIHILYMAARIINILPQGDGMDVVCLSPVWLKVI